MSETFKQFYTAIESQRIDFLDIRFTDLRGKEQHLSVPIDVVDDQFLASGKLFDGSSIAGFKPIQASDMLLKLDLDTAIYDPFLSHPTLIVRADIFEPDGQTPYSRCPRNLAKRAEAYLKETGIADTCYIGPEPEFFIFDDVRWQNVMHACSFRIDSREGAWNSETTFETGNLGHRPAVKGGYFPVPPVDSSQDLRSQICLYLRSMGITPEAHHHEVATANQNEITTRFTHLLRKADELQLLKYAVHNTAQQLGKTATFMPKPLLGDNGSGMHCHQSLALNGVNIFAGKEENGLSELALYYIGGILKHARALNAFCNPTTNSYKRLVPGFEAPIYLAYSAYNRSAAVRIPALSEKNATRIEVRFPDPCANPYYAFSAMLLAGIDGIKNKITPGEACQEDLFAENCTKSQGMQTVCFSLDDALQALNKDRAFLLQGDVFSDDLIDAYIALKKSEIARLNSLPHPVEFELYYSA